MLAKIKTTYNEVIVSPVIPRFSSLTKCLQLQSVSKVEANLREQAIDIHAKGFADLTAVVYLGHTVLK